MADFSSRDLLRVGAVCVIAGFALSLFAPKVDIGAASILVFGFALMAWPALTERLTKLSFGSGGLSLEIRDRLSAVEETAAGAAATVGALTAAQAPGASSG